MSIAPADLRVRDHLRGRRRQVVDDPELGLDYGRVVHGDQKFAYTRPVRAGDRLTRRRHHRAHQVAGGQRHAGHARRGARRGRRARRDATSTLVVARRPRRRTRDGAAAYDEVEVGTELPAADVPVTRADLVRYAGASGDFNPIHWNERFASEVGLPDVIAHGMFTMALAGRVVTDWAGDPGAVVEYGVRFTRPVVVPDDDVGATVEVGGSRPAVKLDGEDRCAST